MHRLGTVRKDLPALSERQQRTAAELRAALLQAVGRNPDCEFVRNVLIERQPYIPYWRACWIMDGDALRPAAALEIERHLQAQFDLKD